jgi:acetyl esterase/lipase
MHSPTLARWALALAGPCIVMHAAETPAEVAPTEYVYKQVGDTALKVAVFAPPGAPAARRPAVAIFHGGGWNIGRLEWTHGDARLLAAAGCVGVGVQYPSVESGSSRRDAPRRHRRRPGRDSLDSGPRG